MADPYQDHPSNPPLPQVDSVWSSVGGAVRWLPRTNLGIGVFNVRDFGAVGDGVADDSSAIQSAIDAAKASGGGLVFFPQGTYLIGTPLTLWSRVRLWGVSFSPNGCRIKAKNGLNNAIIKCGATDGTDPNWHWGEINYITVDGNKANQSLPTASTVSTATSSGIVATITTTTSHGLSIGDVVVLSGFTPDGYNGRYPVNGVISSTVFTVNLLFGVGSDASGVGTARRAVNCINIPQAGETSLVSAVVENALEDGIYQGPVGTPMNYGRIQVVSNTLAGISLWTDRPVVIQDISGDSNGGGLLRVNGKASAGGNAVGSVTVVFIKAENHSVPVVTIDDYAQSVTLVGGAITMNAGNVAPCIQRTSVSQNSRLHSIGVTYTPQWSGAGNIFQDLSPAACSVNTGNSSATSKEFHVTDSNDGVGFTRITRRMNVLTDSLTPIVPATVGDYHELTCTGAIGASRTISAPTGAPNGQPRVQQITIRIFNNTGGAITTAWNAIYLLAGAWVDPATGKSRLVTFLYNGTNWIEMARTPVDV